MNPGGRFFDVWAGAISRLSRRFSRYRLDDLLGATVRSQLAGIEEGVILNVGAGGAIERELRRLDVRFLSIDIDPARGPDRVMDLEDLKEVPGGSVRAVFLLEVLEHVRHPSRAAAEMERVLRPGGVVIGSTPFMLGIHDAPHDYQRFTCHGLAHLFGSFETIQLEARDGYFRALATLCMRWLKHRADRREWAGILLTPVLVPLAFFFVGLDWIWPGGEATTGYFFVFRRR